uniref:Coiled-coil domain containing 71 n=1 Tax=Oryzias latipes TaxID=8090 RepID=A0A3P9M302_ORYLA
MFREMSDTPQGSLVSRPLAFTNEERRAVHSWSRISSAGLSVLLDTQKVLSPMSRDLSSTEELVTFLQELCEEGHRPIVLRSKEVYGYRSYTSQPLTEDMLKLASKNVNRPAAKKRKRKPMVKKREVHPSWISSDRNNPRIQGIRPAEVLVDHHTVVGSRTASQIVEMSLVDLQPCLRLTNIEGLSGFPTARLQIHTIRHPSSEMQTVTFPSQQHCPTLSGIPSQPSQNGGGASTKAVALFSHKSLSCPIRLDGALIGDSAPVFNPNGRVFPQTHTELTSNGWRGNGVHRDVQGSKDLGNPAGRRNSWKDKKHFIRRVIKVDDSRSVAEARQKAQKILQVNLSPVIQIQPLNRALRDFRLQRK